MPLLSLASVVALSIPAMAQTQPNPLPGQPQPAWQQQANPRYAQRPRAADPAPAQMATPSPNTDAVPATTPASAPAPIETAASAPSVLQLPAHRALVRVGPGGLSIKAENSNLSQILRDVASATGTKVSGLAGDERIFGNYGPGNADDVINDLLYGSDYNLLMVGGTHPGTPRELILTRRSNSSVAAVPAETPPRSDDDSESGTVYEDQDAPPQPTAFPPNAFPPGQPRAPIPPPQNPVPGSSPEEPVRTPQQLLEQLQQMHRQSDGAQDNSQPPASQP